MCVLTIKLGYQSSIFMKHFFPILTYYCSNRACSVAKKPVSPLAQPRRAASFHTFAENKGEAPMAPPSESFSHPRGPVRFLVPRSTLCGQPSRGFKSRRAEDDGGYPFKTTTTAAINDYR